EALIAGTRVQVLLRYHGHRQPEESVDDITGEDQEVHRRCADYRRVLHGTDRDLLGQLAPLLDQRDQISHIAAKLGMALVALAEQVNLLAEGAQQLALAHQHLAAQEVQRLDAVGPFIDGSDTAITYLLFLTPLADVAMAAEHLHAEQ